MFVIDSNLKELGLADVLDNESLIIVGHNWHSKINEYIAEYLANELFFQSEYSVVAVFMNDIEQTIFLDIVKSKLKEFGIKYTNDYPNIIQYDNSAIITQTVHNWVPITQENKIDVFYVAKNEHLVFSQIKNLIGDFNKIIITTLDYTDNVYYNAPIKNTYLYTDPNLKSILNNVKNKDHTYLKLVKGEFSG